MKKNKEQKVETKPVEKDMVIKEEKKEKSFGKVLKIFILRLFFLFVFLAAFFALLQEPRVKKYYVEFFGLEESREIRKLNEEVEYIKEALAASSESNSRLLGLKDNFADLDRKFEILEENNLNTIRSKADVALVLGIIGRLDNIESRLNEAAKVSGNGALLAMAAALVKDAAERGGDFIYEASVLEQLARDESQIRDYVATVQKYSKDGIHGAAFLSNEFEKIYRVKFASEEASADMEEGNDWKSRLNKKLGEIIVVKYKKASEKAEEEKIAKQETNLDTVMFLINSGEFEKAVKELSDEKYNTLISSNEMLNSWYYQAKARIEFFDAVSKVSAYSLGVMKADGLK